MSYIRSLSNPEGLYIFASWNDVFITEGHNEAKTMPVELWNKLLTTWVKNFYDNVALTLVIDGVKHEVNLCESLEPALSMKIEALEKDGEVSIDRDEEIFRSGSKICIEYKNDEGKSWTLDNIWPVTMHYIASRFENPYYSAGRFKRLILRLLGV